MSEFNNNYAAHHQGSGVHHCQLKLLNCLFITNTNMASALGEQTPIQQLQRKPTSIVACLISLGLKEHWATPLKQLPKLPGGRLQWRELAEQPYRFFEH